MSFKYSIIIPIFKNELNIPPLIEEICSVCNNLSNTTDTDFKNLEIIFVDDGSPDNSYNVIKENLTKSANNSFFSAKIVSLSRNFGSFAAIRSGLFHADSDFYAVIAADQQEPFNLMFEFFTELTLKNKDIVFGKRSSREDPLLSQLSAKLFWFLYKRFVIKDIPEGGVDIFACNRSVRDAILSLHESNSSLLGLLFWVGFKRSFISYERKKRTIGVSSWSFKKKIKYMLDSIFSFTDLPIRIIMVLGFLGVFLSSFLGFLVLIFWLLGYIKQPGYTPTILIMTFFFALTMLSQGIIGNYIWRSFENTKKRPNSIVMKVDNF